MNALLGKDLIKSYINGYLNQLLINIMQSPENSLVYFSNSQTAKYFFFWRGI